MNYKVPQGTVDAARSLLGSKAMHVSQVHEITLRTEDPNAEVETMRVVRLVPIGNVIGIAITNASEVAKDADFVFVSASALGNAIPALGFTGAVRPADTLVIVPPGDGK